MREEGARDQESNGTAQEPNEQKSKGGRGRILDIGDGMENTQQPF